MTVGLWTRRFVRICLANLFLFVSQYALFPALPIEMADNLDGVSVEQAGVFFLVFTLGMFLIGPFHAYLVDAYKRKHVCLTAFALVVLMMAGYAFVSNFAELLLLGLLQGAAFGVATTAGITLAIDITSSSLRSSGNISFMWMARLGMILGLTLGVCLYRYCTFHTLLCVAVGGGVCGLLALAGVYVPFRAPIVTHLCSFDRFLLPRAWVPAVNTLLIAFVPGLLMPLVHPAFNDISLGDVCHFSLPFYAGVGGGYLVSLLLARLFSFSVFVGEKQHTLRNVLVGVGLQLLSLFALRWGEWPCVSSLLMGIGLGWIMPEFLAMFVKLSFHCQRGTANTTHLLANEAGIALGIAMACRMDMDTEGMLVAGQTVLISALLIFVLITYPYYIKKKVR